MNPETGLKLRRVVVVDYGMGNLRSVAQALSKVAPKGMQVHIESQPKAILAASHVVLPGQGAMPDCMRAMRSSGLLEAVLEAATSKPLLGICVGQQMLMQKSEEGPTDSLGLFAGDVVRFPAEYTTAKGLKVPHMGWNQVEQIAPHPLWAGIPNFAWFYFVHSYYCKPVNATQSVASSMHGLPFTCAIARDNIFATQFHPEKSAHCGLRLYQNFLNWQP